MNTVGILSWEALGSGQNINIQKYSACFSTSAFQGLTTWGFSSIGSPSLLSSFLFPCLMSLLDLNLDLLELEIAKPLCPLGFQQFSSV